MASGGITTCVNTPSAAPNLQRIVVSGTGLSTAITATAPAGFEVSVTENNGFGNVAILPQTGGNANGSIYVRAAAISNSGNITGKVVLSSAGAVPQSVNVDAIINALPVVNTIANQSYANGEATIPIVFTGTADNYRWTNDNPAIGIAAAGTGNIPSFTALNTGNAPVVATFKVTPAPTGYLYAANYDKNSVSVINTSTNAIVSTIGLGVDPVATVVNHDKRKFYVITKGAVEVFNTSDNGYLTRINTPGTARCLLVSPDQSKIFIAVADGPAPGTFMVVDAATDNVIGSLTIGPVPMYAVCSSDGGHVYIPTYGIAGGGPLYAINISTLQIENTFSSVSNYPSGISISQDDKTLYLSDRNLNKIIVINLTNNSVTGIPVGNYPNQPLISPDGNTLYVDNMLSNDVSVVNLLTNTVIATIPTGTYNKGIAITPDGKFLYVTNRASQSITVINTVTKSQVTIIPTPGIGIDNPVMSLDGNHVYAIDSYAKVLHIINTNTNTLAADIPTEGVAYIVPGSLSIGNGCYGLEKSFTITVNPPPPGISTTGSPVPVTTTYGTASAPASFSLSGLNLTGPVTVTAPPGFEVSTSLPGGFSNAINVGSTGNVALTTIYIRLTAIADAGNYGGNITLSSPGAATVNVVMPNSTVTPQPLNISVPYEKTYGDVLGNTTLYYNTPGFTFTDPGFKNGNSFNAIDITFNTGALGTDNAGTYTNAVVVTNLSGRNGFLSSNYAVTYTPANLVILPTPLTVTASKATKTYGNTLTNANTATGFTTTGLKNGEIAGTVYMSYGSGAEANAAAGTYTGSVTPSNAAGGTFSPLNYTITYVAADIEVLVPILNGISTPQAVSTTFGTPSLPGSFQISGINVAPGLTITAPAGFEVSTNNIAFNTTATLNLTGTISMVPVYVRLAATTNAGFYTGNVVLQNGPTTLNVLMPISTVNRSPLTIKAKNAKKYYGDILVDVANANQFDITSGTLKNGNTISTVYIEYGAGKTTQPGVGVYSGSVNINANGIFGGSGFLAGNYNITLIPGDIEIEPQSLVISAHPFSKQYGTVRTLPAGYTGTTLKNADQITNLTYTYVAGNNATDPVAVYPGAIQVSNLVGNFNYSNYTISYKTANLEVTKAPLTITVNNAGKKYGEENPAFSVSYKGFLNGEDERVLTIRPQISTLATASAAAGKYAITASGAQALNYEITYVDGELAVAPPTELIIPNTFTPNNDGVNDVWSIPALASYPNCTVEVFNRYGIMVYRSVGYSNAWNGTGNGQNLPSGVYYYVIDAKMFGKKATGNITIIR